MWILHLFFIDLSVVYLTYFSLIITYDDCVNNKIKIVKIYGIVYQFSAVIEDNPFSVDFEYENIFL